MLQLAQRKRIAAAENVKHSKRLQRACKTQTEASAQAQHLGSSRNVALSELDMYSLDHACFLTDVDVPVLGLGLGSVQACAYL